MSLNRKFTVLLVPMFFYTAAAFCQGTRIRDDIFNNPLQDYSFMAEYTSHPVSLVAERLGYYSRVIPNTKVMTAPLFSAVAFFGPVNCAGRTRAILPDRTSPGLIFAGSTSGGLWKSVDGGSSWTVVDDQSQGMNITCIDQNPFDPAIIYYGTGEHKARNIRDLGSGVYRSVDHGMTFTALDATKSDTFMLINSVKHSLADSATLYVATTNHGLFRSSDHGNSFQQVFDNGEKITDIECFTDGKVMVTSSYDGIYYSFNGDPGTFVKATGTPAHGFSRIEIAYCDSFPQVVYATFADSVQTLSSGLEGAYKSLDGGVSWFPITNPDAVGYYCYADYMMSIAVKPDDPDVLITGGAQACYSVNGGQSYTKLIYPRFDHHTFVFNRFDNDIWYSGQDQGIYRFDFSQLPPASSERISSYSTAQIWGGSFFPSGDNFLIGVQDNMFQKNSNQHRTFSRLRGYGSNGKSVHVHQQNPNIGYISGDNASLKRSVTMADSIPVFSPILNELDADGNGAVDDDVWHNNRFEMNYLDGDQLYLPTRDYVWRSTNGGNNWNKITNSFAGSDAVAHPYSIGLSNELCPVVYVSGTKGLFIRIDEACHAVQGSEADLSLYTPSELVAGGKISCLAVHPFDNGTVYATVEHKDSVPRIWKITGANTSAPLWNDISGNFNGNINTYWIETDPEHPDSALFIGTDTGLWGTRDGGITWSREPAIPPVTVYQARLRRTDRQLFVYTFGRGIWKCSLPGSHSSGGTVHFDPSLTLYPNPAGSTVHLSVRGTAVRKIVVTDLAGREVAVPVVPSASVSGDYTAEISGLSHGIYLVTAHADNGQVSQKLIRQ